MPDQGSKLATINRLRRVEGQLRGVTQMIENDRYCIDVLTQLQAVKAAIARVEDQVLKSHADHCVAEAIASGDAQEQRAKFTELVDLLARARK